MRHSGAILAASLVILAGCGGGVSPSSPTDAAPETGTSTSTPTVTPTLTRTRVPTECHTLTPPPNPDRITHHIGISNNANRSYEVAVTVTGNATTRTRTKTMEPHSGWVAMNITEPGTYTLRVETENGPESNATITPPYAAWPTRADSTSMVAITQNGTITVENVYEPVLPTPVCS